MRAPSLTLIIWEFHDIYIYCLIFRGRKTRVAPHVFKHNKIEAIFLHHGLLVRDITASWQHVEPSRASSSSALHQSSSPSLHSHISIYIFLPHFFNHWYLLTTTKRRPSRAATATTTQHFTKKQRSLQLHELGCSCWTFLACLVGKIVYFRFLPWFLRYYSLRFFCTFTYLPPVVSQKSLQLTKSWLVALVWSATLLVWIYIYRLSIFLLAYMYSFRSSTL